jgi:hypothetical protein
MNLIYQILCDVRVLHEYFLTDSNNASVFQDATQIERLAWLTRRGQEGLPAGAKDLQFILPPCMTTLFRNQDLRLLPTMTGFQVAVHVNPTTQGGTTRFAPTIPMPGAMNLIILMQTGDSFPAITNSRMKRPVDSLYYFSNVSLGNGAKTAPALSRPISAPVNGYTYEQGELAANGSQVELYYYPGPNASATTEVVPGNGFVNENDRLIVPTTFDYDFQPTDTVTSAQFTLKDPNNNVVRTYTYESPAPLTSVTLVFDNPANPTQPTLTALPKAGAADPILYTLEVTGNGNYTQTIPLIFYTNASDLNSMWGVIQLQVQVPDADFSLLDSSGLLYTPQLAAPDQTNSPYPVFEIRCKSRYTFWNYQCEDPAYILNQPAANSPIAPFVQATATTGVLETTAPIPSTYLPYFFSQDPNAQSPTFTYLPNPSQDAVVEIAGNQVISNIWVPTSGIFPTSPAPT